MCDYTSKVARNNNHSFKEFLWARETVFTLVPICYDEGTGCLFETRDNYKNDQEQLGI